MKCPKCQRNQDRVIDSRELREGELIRRRRECGACGHRYTTYEKVDRNVLMVLKRDQRREEFSEKKLLESLRLSVAKRPVDEVQVRRIAEDIRKELEKEHEGDGLVPSTEVGMKVLKRLEALDEVAYLRYASIYKRFRDATQFLSEIDNLIGRP